MSCIIYVLRVLWTVRQPWNSHPALALLLGSLLTVSAYAAPNRSELEKQGLDAMAAHLPEVAAARFRARLEAQPADPQEKLRLQLLLGESLVRANQPDQALAVLTQESLHESPMAKFWVAQAHRARGEIQAAIDILDAVIERKDFPLAAEAILSRSRMLAALGNDRAAIANLNLLTTSKSPLAVRAKIDQTRLLLHTGKFEDARKTLPSAKSLKGIELLEVKLLDAALLHEEAQFSRAIDAYRAILSIYQKDGEALPAQIHPAAIGVARAKASMNQRSEATDTLLSFIQNQPDSPHLHEAFRLLQSLMTNSAEKDDPTVTLINARLAQWSVSPPHKQPAILPDSNGNAMDLMATPYQFEFSELHAQSQFLRLLAMAQSAEGEALDELRRMGKIMLLVHAVHPLCHQASIELSRALYRNAQAQKANDLLENLLLSCSSSATEIEAHLLLAKSLYQQQDYAAAAQSFERAAALLQSSARSNAQFNLGIALLHDGDIDAFEKLQQQSNPKLLASLQLEHALFTATTQPQIALVMLDRFILENATHPRLNEARLAMAYCAMEQIPPSLSMARALLDALDQDAQLRESVLIAQIQLALAASELSRCISLAREFLSLYPESAHQAKVTLSLGAALYQNGDLSDARQTLQKLEKSHPEKAGPALLMAARAAARTGTPQSLAEAIELFDRVIAVKSNLSPYASLEKARTLMDAKSLNSLQQAAAELEGLYASQQDNQALKLSAGILWMETLYALGSSDVNRHKQGLELQLQLLKDEQINADDRNRISYFRGLTLEQMNQFDQALDIYYQVIESAASQKLTQWEYFDRCGFNAIALLEKKQRWEPAIALAKKLSTFPSPRAKEAAERAERLSLEHMILEE